MRIMSEPVKNERQLFTLTLPGKALEDFSLQIPGHMNVMNATAAITLGFSMCLPLYVMQETLASFPGVWRRFERVAEREGVLVVSDYGHHPTAVRMTLEAAKAFYPTRRIVLCFQPHHRNRTRHLFNEFIPSFDLADALLLVEIYDVPGREHGEDTEVSSRDLVAAIHARDKEQGTSRPIEYANDPLHALEQLRAWKKSGDVILVMGAGTIYTIATQIL